MRDEIAWAGDPPVNPTARIWTPKEGKQWVCVLGPWVGVWVHWTGKRTLPCLEGRCPAARHRRPMVWIGYTPACLPVRSHETGTINSYRPIVLPIGPGLADDLRPALAGFPGPAIIISAKEKGKGLILHEVKPLSAGVQLPDCPDVEATLYRLWQMRPPTQDGGEIVE